MLSLSQVCNLTSIEKHRASYPSGFYDPRGHNSYGCTFAIISELSLITLSTRKRNRKLIFSNSHHIIIWFPRLVLTDGFLKEMHKSCFLYGTTTFLFQSILSLVTSNSCSEHHSQLLVECAISFLLYRIFLQAKSVERMNADLDLVHRVVLMENVESGGTFYPFSPLFSMPMNNVGFSKVSRYTLRW